MDPRQVSVCVVIASPMASVVAWLQTASGDVYAETREMGGRIARDQLKMKLPAFAARTGRTTSGISRTTSAVSRQTSFAGSRTTSYVPGEGPSGMSEV